MNRLLVLTCVAALGLPAAANAQQPAQQQPSPEPKAPAAPSQAAAKSEPEPVVCSTITVTGSRVRQRVCGTKSAATQEVQSAIPSLMQDKDLTIPEYLKKPAGPGGL
jgi:hypothetical protein